ncbi:MAG: cupin domain-containing protein [Pirellulaceae bacterium]
MGPIDLEREPTIQLAAGVKAQVPHGEKIMFSRVTIEEGAEVPLHAHPHEQGGCVIEGTLQLEIEGTSYQLAEGDLYLIPGGAEHCASGVGGSVTVLDVFGPVREDYAKKRKQCLS